MKALKYIGVIFFLLLTGLKVTHVHELGGRIHHYEHDVARDIQLDMVFFVPDDPTETMLLDLINRESKAIWLAQFRLSHKAVIEALCNARRRNVEVRVIVDSTCLQDKSEKISILLAHGIKVHKYTKIGSIMHHKFILFFKNSIYGTVLWTGSANCTGFGLKKNRENVIITNRSLITQRYGREFEKLWLNTLSA